MKLIEFYGKECPHCISMKPLIQQLEKELNVKVKKLEIWHNQENAQKMHEVNHKLNEKGKPGCNGVPFFYNVETEGVICGATSYENLLAWAKGKEAAHDH